MVSNLFSLQGLIGMLISAPFIFICLTVHEFAHGYVAYKLGDNTAKNAGRLTLNPISHIDWIGALSLLIFQFGWAKPVPINPYNFNKAGARGIVWVSLAGPLSNLLFALISMIILGILLVVAPEFTLNVYVWTSIIIIVKININLCIFNLIPIPPLDGSKIFMYFTSYKTRIWIEQNQMMLYMFLMLVVFSGMLGRIINPISNTLLSGMLQFIKIIFPQISTYVV